MYLIPIIDLFAGPGGLGEGFTAFRNQEDEPVFDVLLSVEKDLHAHKTLELRSFFRKFSPGCAPDAYYDYLRAKSTITRPEYQDVLRSQLYGLFPEKAEKVRDEVWRAELGGDAGLDERIDSRIRDILRSTKAGCWGIIGGPPCQAYSVIGRNRNSAITGYSSDNDSRSHLYKQYLRIIARHQPSFFIMENVKGMLSAKLNGNSLFEKMLEDLRMPARHFNGDERSASELEYLIFPFACNSLVPQKPTDFIIETESYGIPQMRQRVILLGVRKDFSDLQPRRLERKNYRLTVREMIANLPKIRSGISKVKEENNSYEFWSRRIREMFESDWLKRSAFSDVAEEMDLISMVMEPFRAGQGGEYISCHVPAFSRPELTEWFLDDRLGGVCNHTSRSHMVSDLHRYYFAAAFAEIRKRSPLMDDFPEELLPAHKNARSGHFDDRFRVQMSDRPSSTITSHISKDGHYFIHYDPEQCRSLTVREAARLQTFPDNYSFEGPRTEQYTQVGNAVPPLLARQIAEIVSDLVVRTENRIRFSELLN